MAKTVITSASCTIKEVTKDVATRFVSENGGKVDFSQYTKYYGLFYSNVLVYVFFPCVEQNDRGGVTGYLWDGPPVHRNYTISDLGNAMSGRLYNYARSQNPFKIYSNSCTIKEVSKNDVTKFNTEHNISVNLSNYTKYYGLEYSGQFAYMLYVVIGTNGGVSSSMAAASKYHMLKDQADAKQKLLNYIGAQYPLRLSSASCSVKEVTKTDVTKFNTDNNVNINLSAYTKYYGLYYGSGLVYVLYVALGSTKGVSGTTSVANKIYALSDQAVARERLYSYAQLQNPYQISYANCTIKEVTKADVTKFNTDNSATVNLSSYTKYYGLYYGNALVYVLYVAIGTNGGVNGNSVAANKYYVLSDQAVAKDKLYHHAQTQNPIKISSTSCSIKDVSGTDAAKFNSENNISINLASYTKYYGLYNGSVLVYLLYTTIGATGGLNSYTVAANKCYTLSDQTAAIDKLLDYARRQNPIRLSSASCTIKDVSIENATKFNTDNGGGLDVSKYSKIYGLYNGNVLVYVLYVVIGTNKGVSGYSAVTNKYYALSDSTVAKDKLYDYAQRQNSIQINSANCTIKELTKDIATKFNTDNTGNVDISKYGKYYGLYNSNSVLVYVLYVIIGANGGVNGFTGTTNKYYALNDQMVAKDKIYSYAREQNPIKISSANCNIKEVSNSDATKFNTENGGNADISMYGKYYGYYYNINTLVGVLYVQIGANGEVQASVFKSHKYYSITDGDARILNYANTQNLKEIDIINEVNAWKVDKLTDNIVKQFFTNNSGQFIDKALYCGLYYNNDLVAVLAAKHTSTADKHIVEKLSYNEKKYYKIIQGESYLLHYAKSQYPNKVKLEDQISAWSAYIINDEATLKIFYIENNGGDISQTADAFYGLYYNDDLVAISAVRVGDDGNVIEESYCTSTEYERNAGDIDGGIVGGHTFLRKQVQIANQIKVYSRDCKIVTVSAPTATLFYQQNEGGDINPEADAFYGLYYNNEIIAIMAFKDNKKLQYCWKPNFSISEGEIYLNQYVSAMSQINGTNETSKKVLEIASSSNTIPFDQMIGAPLIACVNAQSMASMETLKFVKEAGFKKSEKEGSDFEVVNVSFSYKNGNEMFSLSVPLLTIIPVPYLQIDTVKINFSADMYTTENNEVVAKFATTDLSAEKKQTSKYNVQNQLNIEIKASSGSMPSGMAKMLDIFNNCIEVSQEVVEKNSLEMPTEHMTEAQNIIEDTPSAVENEEDAVEDESDTDAQQTPDSTQKTSTKKSKKK